MTLTSEGVTINLTLEEAVTFLQFIFAFIVVDALIALMYESFVEGYVGATMGNLALKIRVVGEDGSHCGLASAYVRNLLHLVDAVRYIIPYLLGLIKIRKSSKKQRFGDKVARTNVVKKGVPSPMVPLPAPPPKLFCNQCGKEISPEFNLCPFCGAKILRSNETD